MATFEINKENVLATLQKRAVLELNVPTMGVTVTHVSQPLMKEDGSEYRIINLAAMTKRQAQFAIKAFREGNYEQALNGAEDFGRTSLSFQINEGQPCPLKGDVVDVRLGLVKSKRLGQDIEAIVALGIPPKQNAKTIDFASLVEEPVDMDNE